MMITSKLPLYLRSKQLLSDSKTDVIIAALKKLLKQQLVFQGGKPEKGWNDRNSTKFPIEYV